jgi:hypothetical protein
MVDALLIIVHVTGLAIGFWCGGRLGRLRPHILRRFHAYPADGQADAPRQPTSSLSFQPVRPSGVGGAA